MEWERQGGGIGNGQHDLSGVWGLLCRLVSAGHLQRQLWGGLLSKGLERSSCHCSTCRRWGMYGQSHSKGKTQMKTMFPGIHPIALHFSGQLILVAVFSLDQHVIYFGFTKSHTTGMRLVFLPTENHLLFSRQQLFCSVSLHLLLLSVFSYIFNHMHSFFYE